MTNISNQDIEFMVRPPTPSGKPVVTRIPRHGRDAAFRHDDVVFFCVLCVAVVQLLFLG